MSTSKEDRDLQVEADGAESAGMPSAGDTVADETGGANTTLSPKINPDTFTIIGAASWLMMQSPAHRTNFISEGEWRLMPALHLGQFRLIRRRGLPIAFVTWAFVSEEIDARFKTGTVKLAPNEWKIGDIPWLVDIVAPFGGNNEIIKQLLDGPLGEQDVRTLVPTEDRRGLRVVSLRRQAETEPPEPDANALDVTKAATAKDRLSGAASMAIN